MEPGEPFCQLLPRDGSHASVNLEDRKEVVIGRSSSTAIVDRKCSRQQVEVCAQYDKKVVCIKHLGYHPGRVAGGRTLQKGDTCVLGQMGWFEPIQGYYRYHVYFGMKVIDQWLCSPSPEKKIKCSTESKSIEANLSCWKDYDTLMIYEYGCAVYSRKIAMFDLDNTLIQTVSGKKFPTDHKDWKFMEGVDSKLKLVSKDHKIVILSNQLGISKGTLRKEDFMQKIEAIAAKLNLSFLLLASTANDKYRKPCTGMWEYFVSLGNEVDKELSFYVGDAAGRMDNWISGKKKDFSNSDRKFAANLSLTFYTPEEFFLDYPKCEKFSFGSFNPMEFNPGTYQQVLKDIPSQEQEMLIFVGYPASGKSFFFKMFLESHGYFHINRDTLGSWQKCVSKCNELLKAGHRVVIDNTNPDVESRKRYIDLASKFSVPVRCFQFMTSFEHSKHNNKFRELTAKKGIKDIAFNFFKSRYVEPTLDEGYTKIVQVDFIPHFIDKKQETLYHSFLL